MKRLGFLVIVVAVLFAVLTTMPGTALAGGGPDPNTVNGLPRRGPGRFIAGEAVVGFEIHFENVYTYRQCYVSRSPYGGYVIDGVVNPWLTEVTVPPCGLPYSVSIPQPPPSSGTVNGQPERQAVGWTRFGPNEAALGDEILLDNSGRKCTIGNCYSLSPGGTGGWIFNGWVNPQSWRIPAFPVTDW